MSNTTAVKEKIKTSTSDHPLTNQNLSKSKIEQIINKHTQSNIPNPLSADYEEPIEYGNYMKFEEGDNKIRILSEGIVGKEYWEVYESEDGKEKKRPLRVPKDGSQTIDLSEVELDIDSDPKIFEAYFIYNYEAEKVQIMNVTQKNITRGIRSYTKNPRWGSPDGYDLVITKTVKAGDPRHNTSYSVIAEPHSVLEEHIQKQWEALGFIRESLFLLYEGLDPFEEQKQLLEKERKNPPLIKRN